MKSVSVIGLFAGLVLVVFGIAFGSGFGALRAFLHFPSFMITFGGTFGSVLIMQRGFKSFGENIASIRLIVRDATYDAPDMIRTIVTLSFVARKNGLLALDHATEVIDDDYLRKGVQLIADGTDQAVVRDMMETELACMEARHSTKIAFWRDIASMAPAWGMIGTLIGLIRMLGSLADVKSIGPNMATALITTFYGAMIANWICIPIANRLQQRNDAEVHQRQLILEGLSALQSGLPARVIEEKLRSFLPAGERFGAYTMFGSDVYAAERKQTVEDIIAEDELSATFEQDSEDI
jgi:chemotaxis protein MotA